MGKPNRTKRKIREWDRYLDHCDEVTGTKGHSVSWAWGKLMNRESRQFRHAVHLRSRRRYSKGMWRRAGLGGK